MAVRFVKLADTLHPADDEAREWLLNASEEDALELKGGSRTSAQNRSMWLYCERLAQALNEAGYDQTKFPYREGLELPFTKTAVMENFWRPVQEALVGTTSTKDLEKSDINAIYEALDKAMASRVGVHVEFPHAKA